MPPAITMRMSVTITNFFIINSIIVDLLQKLKYYKALQRGGGTAPRRAHNPQTAGSTPAPATKLNIVKFCEETGGEPERKGSGKLVFPCGKLLKPTGFKTSPDSSG